MLFPYVSDDELIYLIRRNNIEAYRLLFNRYLIFINKWVKDYNFSSNEIDGVKNDSIERLHKVIKWYDEDKGNFYSFVSISLKRYMLQKLNKLSIYYSHYIYCIDSEENVSNKLYLNDKNIDEIPLEKIRKYFSKEDCEIIRLYLMQASYQFIADKLNITKKHVEYTLSKFRTFKKNIDKYR